MYRGVAAETATPNAAVTNGGARWCCTRAGRPPRTTSQAPREWTEDIQNSFLGSTPEPWLLGVADATETKTSDWKLSFSFRLCRRSVCGALVGGPSVASRCSTRGRLAADRLRWVLGSRREPGERARTGGPPRAEQHVGVLRREERHAPHKRADPQRTRTRTPPAREAHGDSQRRPRPAGRPAGAGERRVEQCNVVPTGGADPEIAPPARRLRYASVASADTLGAVQARTYEHEHSLDAHRAGMRGVASLASGPHAGERVGRALGRYGRPDRVGCGAPRRGSSPQRHGDGASACGILNAPLRATEHGRACTQRWDARLAKLLHEAGAARGCARSGGSASAVVVVRGNWATIAVGAADGRSNRFYWTENCWMLAG